MLMQTYMKTFRQTNVEPSFTNSQDETRDSDSTASFTCRSGRLVRGTLCPLSCQRCFGTGTRVEMLVLKKDFQNPVVA